MAVAGVQTLKAGVYVAIHGFIAPFDQFERNPSSGKYYLK